MPRRSEPDELSRKIGLRVAHFRWLRGFTLEELAARCIPLDGDNEDSLGASKGHMSNVEHGLVRPTVHTLQRIANAMGIELVDLVNFPEDGPRSRLIDCTRELTRGSMRKVVRDIESAPKRPKAKDPAPKKVRNRVTKKKT